MSVKHLLSRRQTLAVLLTIAIIGGLLFIPQASAIRVEISGITSGETITLGVVKELEFRIVVESGEVVPVQEIRVVIDGVQYTAPPTGGDLTPANSIIPTITLVTPPPGYFYSASYGYGYGYLYGYGYAFGYGYRALYGYGYGYGFTSGSQIRYSASLYTSYLSLGSHTIRVDVATGLQPSNIFSSQTISFTLVSPPTPTQPAPSAPPTASDLEAMSAEERAAQLTQMNASDAANRIEQMSVDKAVEAIKAMNATDAARILNLVNTTRAAQILARLTVEEAVRITLNLNVDKAADVVLTMDVREAAPVVEGMTRENLHRAAQVVDNMIAKDAAGAARVIDELPPDVAADLLLEIAGLPSTPEKAAMLIDAMSLTKAVDAVKSIIASNKMQTLAQILSHVSTSRLNEIFKQLSSSERLRTLPYLDAATQARLKHVKATLTVERVDAQPGSSVKVRLALSSTQPIPEGSVSFSIPAAFKTKALSVEGLPGTSAREATRLIVTKLATQPSYAAASVAFDLVVPLNASVSVGQIVTVVASVNVPDFAVSFDTPTAVSVTVVKPTVQSIFSALNSYFDKTVSVYTEGRVPVKQDIYSLLDFYFRGRVD
ncbi:MAG: hypothetical protein QXN08_03920 [Nitrososphaerales archaeon]